MSTKGVFTGRQTKEVRVFKIATAFMFGSTIVLASDAGVARPRFRSAPPPPKPPAVQTSKPATMKPATIRPSKPVTAHASKPETSQPQKPFAAAPRPDRNTFININARPFAAAPAQRAMPDSADYAGPVQFDPALAVAGNRAPARLENQSAATTDPVVPTPAPNEPLTAQPEATPVRIAAPSMSAAAGGFPRPHTVIVCYVQVSGACVPF
jgi:hypothetical protein